MDAYLAMPYNPVYSRLCDVSNTNVSVQSLEPLRLIKLTFPVHTNPPHFRAGSCRNHFRLIKLLLSEGFTKDQGQWIELKTGHFQRKEKERGKGEEGLTTWAPRQVQVEAPPLKPGKSRDYLERADERRLA